MIVVVSFVLKATECAVRDYRVRLHELQLLLTKGPEKLTVGHSPQWAPV